MRGTVSIVIGTYGDLDYWDAVAEKAIDSAKNQTVAAEVIRSHGQSLQEARNYGAEEATGEWLIFLDADDELDLRYVEEMLTGTGDIRQPATLGIVDGVPDRRPVVIPPAPLLERNYLVIGSMCRRDIFLDVEGFRDLECLEDWDLWIRMVLAGATIGCCADAVYKIHVRQGSRNQDSGIHGRVYQQIQSEYGAYRGSRYL
jgi:glycosyltransferase involved in cell wall biosynthesis